MVGKWAGNGRLGWERAKAKVGWVGRAEGQWVERGKGPSSNEGLGGRQLLWVGNLAQGQSARYGLGKVGGVNKLGGLCQFRERGES